MNDNRNFTPRLGQGDLPDLFDYAVIDASDFQRAMQVWDARMPGYDNLLSCEFVGDRQGLYSSIVEGDWRWLERSHRYRNRKDSTVINDGKWVELRDDFTDAMHSPTTLVTNEMMDRDITLHEWARRMAVLIRDSHLALFMFGCGGYNGISQDGVISIETALRGQYDFLRSFAQQIIDKNRGGDRQEDETGAFAVLRPFLRGGIINRSILYIESATGSAERGRATTYGKMTEELPAYPGDGSTICMTRCRCHWRFNFSPEGGGGSVIHAFWRLRARDRRNCFTCLQRARDWNPYRVLTF